LRGVRDQAAPAACRGRGGRHVTSPKSPRTPGTSTTPGVPVTSAAPRGPRASVPEHLVLTGVLTAEQVAATVAGILAVQREDGAIPWFRGHHLDPWDHVEAAMACDAAREYEAAERAYLWLARHQLEDGSWYAAYADGDPLDITDRGRETNFVAYIAVGVWHHYLATGDDTFLDRMWPVVCAAVEFVLRLQQPGGQ